MYDSYRRGENVWAIVLFDFPTLTQQVKSDYRKLRDTLLVHGMEMLQYSVYVLYMPEGVSAKRLVDAVDASIPREGMVTVLLISNKEYSEAFRFVGPEFLKKPRRKPRNAR